MTNDDRHIDEGFDSVHDTIGVYRILLQAMARPGTVGSIREQAGQLPLPAFADRTGLAIALTLLDGTVRFASRLKTGEALVTAIRGQTMSRPTDPAGADYVFADGDLGEAEIRTITGQLRCGTLPEPELGATLIVQVNELSEAPVDQAMWIAAGPGINDQVGFDAAGLSPIWMVERKRLNAEYPLGIDLIAYDRHGHILALPRTTKIKEENQEWAMSL
ncbi:phosphonate metabolism protein [Paenibacillus terrae HPL-003]|uniref:Phosphonate metabolism protein n=1 Tax=Paenibacillus terrae (strain HPL-003) TaxID=985665 RepID=G7VPR3_PAETH|nr:phosphonate C-P lyase system protein PhnH [Paenibacillus terrae]AET61061.1 phosphonate metabolism protein [Paenibacillus terrae HPL-003]